MSRVIYIGESGVHDHHSGGGRAGTRDGESATYVKQGKLKDLRPPKPGEKFDQTGDTVVDWEITPRQGGQGLMTVRCSGEGGPDQVEVEIESVQLEKPIMSHRKFRSCAEEIEKWRDSPAELRAAMRYAESEADSEGRELSKTAKKAARLIMQGCESYLEFAPVVRRITRRTKTEDKWHDIGGRNGKRENAPSGARTAVGGSWKWLKTGDRVVIRADKTSERIEEWTGAEEWSEDLYD